MIRLIDVLEALIVDERHRSALEKMHKSGSASLVISEAAIDSRQVIPASMFVAMRGERTDGHAYVADAFKRGAHLALVEEEVSGEFSIVDLRGGKLSLEGELPPPPLCLLVDDSLKALQTIAGWWRRTLDLRIIGITGSVGKSTTKELVAAVLSQRYRTMKNPGNLNNEIGLPLTLLRLGRGHERAVLEMGFYVPGEIAFLCDLALPEVGVLTNVGTVHAERAGSQEAIARGKAELVQKLPAAPTGAAILNYDDPWVQKMASETQAEVFYYGLSPEADLWADRVEGRGLEGIRFRLHYRNEVLYLRVPLIGRHSVHTALRAAAVGLVEGLTWDEIISGLQQGYTQLRLVAVYTEQGALVLDDTYNASPESMLAGLNLLSEIDGRRKIAVLGDMLELGPYERQGHELVGRRAASVCDELVCVGQRSKMIIESAQMAGLKSAATVWFDEAPNSVEYLKTSLKEGDVVLVKGGHSMRMDRIVNALEAAV